MMAITEQRVREMEAENEVYKDLWKRLYQHYMDGDITVRGPAFGTWHRVCIELATVDNKGIPYR